MRVGVKTGVARNTRTDGDRRAPLGETGPEPEIFLQPPSQTVQPLGDLFSRPERKIVDALVHFDSGDDALAREKFGERLVAGERALPERLVEQDHPAHEFLYALGAEEQIAIRAAVRLRALDPDRFEARLAGTARFVRREQSLALGKHCCRTLG